MNMKTHDNNLKQFWIMGSAYTLMKNWASTLKMVSVERPDYLRYRFKKRTQARIRILKEW